MTTLRVRARGTALVPDYKLLLNGKKAFVGWTFDPTLGAEVEVIDEKGQKTKPRQGGFKRSDDVVTVDVSDHEIAVEYARALADGDLWPGDTAAADFAKRITGKPVTFDQTFGAPKASKQEG